MLSQLISILCKLMVALILENPTNLPVDPVDLDTLALYNCYGLYHLKDCLLRNFDHSLSLES